MAQPQYAGFWIRVGATIVDTILLILITMPILYGIYGASYFDGGQFSQGPADILISYVMPAAAVILFWVYKSATPGKMVTMLKIVDANTGGKPSTGQFFIRYLGYFIALIPLFIGIIWVAFDQRKQGWHDKLAGTAVVKEQ